MAEIRFQGMQKSGDAARRFRVEIIQGMNPRTCHFKSDRVAKLPQHGSTHEEVLRVLVRPDCIQ